MGNAYTWCLVVPFDVVNIILPRKAANIAFQVDWKLAVQVCVPDGTNHAVGKIQHLLYANGGSLLLV